MDLKITVNTPILKEVELVAQRAGALRRDLVNTASDI
jgi:hypothetical protein